MIARREFVALASSPGMWGVAALVLLLCGVLFTRATLLPGAPASLRDFFGPAVWLLAVMCPAVSMRLVSEELRVGSYDLLASAPIGSATIVLGKFGGAVGFLLLMLLPTLAYPAVLAWAADRPLDVWPVALGYGGMLLAGAVMLSLGLLASCATSSQSVAFLATALTLGLLVVLGEVAWRHVPTEWAGLLSGLSIRGRAGEMARGVFDVSHVLAAGAGTAWALAMATAVLEARRWL